MDVVAAVGLVEPVPGINLEDGLHHLDALRQLGGREAHTTLIDDHVVEGHVPIGAVLRMLRERPDTRGISLPGMPAGSPGMSGEKIAPFVVYEIDGTEPELYAVE